MEEEGNIKKEDTINKIYEKLESNKLIIYTKNTNNKISKNFALNETEKKCFSIIMDILKKYNLTSTICRVAGGWVRDKLLGKESDDIDIALSNMKGSKLAQLINEELYPGQDKVGIIQQNAQKGKHLETATIKICNVWIDFVNLRSEDENVIGTPLIDAERRDLSINSLFYNINEEKVEDWTNKGINDLINGIIETPINADITFKDDPLRILRMLRFALKYKFSISDNINNSIQNNIDKYRNEFYNNISNERIEKELYKILNMNNSSYAIAYLYEYNLLDVILKPNKYCEKNIIENLFLPTTNLYILGEYISEKMKIFDIQITSENFNKIDYGLLLLTLFFRNINVKFGKENATINKLILRETFKTSNDYIKENVIMNENFDELISIINTNNYNRLSVGKILRKIHYKNIIKTLFASICYEYLNKANLNEVITNIDDNVIQPIITKYKNFFDFIIKENMLHIDELKPLYNGQEIIKLLNMKPGKQIGKMLELLIEEQIKDPNITKESALDFLNKKKEEICANSDNNDNHKKNENKKKNKKGK
jgi:tRNA nucleotidyltransferase (CCA-adding enzyme)